MESHKEFMLKDEAALDLIAAATQTMWPVPEHSLGGKFTFNDPKHTAKTMQEWLRDDSGNVLE